MSITAALLYRRFQAGGAPIAMVRHGQLCPQRGRSSAPGAVHGQDWAERGLVESAFLDWLEDEGRVSFPWSMIDKIPPPSERVQEGAPGVADMAIARTNTGTLIAPLSTRDHGVPGAGGRFPQRTPRPGRGGGYHGPDHRGRRKR